MYFRPLAFSRIEGSLNMLCRRSRRLAILLAAGSLTLVAAPGSFAAANGHSGAQIKIPAKGLAPLCLVSPGSPDCKSGVIS
jgi:hypothetical protein